MATEGEVHGQLNDPSGIQAEALATNKTVKQIREEYKAAFERDIGQRADCLTAQEILEFQLGSEPSDEALDHLNRCPECRGLRQAMQVRPNRSDEFRQAVRDSASVPGGAWDWRLGGSLVSAALAAALVLYFPKPLHEQGSSTLASKASEVRIEYKRDSGAASPTLATFKLPAFHATSIQVKDYAPQVATAYILPKTELLLKPSTAEAGLRAHAQASRLLESTFAGPEQTSEAAIRSMEIRGWKHLREGLSIKISDEVSIWVAYKDIGEAVRIKTKALSTEGSLLELEGGKVISVALADPLVPMTGS